MSRFTSNLSPHRDVAPHGARVLKGTEKRVRVMLEGVPYERRKLEPPQMRAQVAAFIHAHGLRHARNLTQLPQRSNTRRAGPPWFGLMVDGHEYFVEILFNPSGSPNALLAYDSDKEITYFRALSEGGTPGEWTFRRLVTNFVRNDGEGGRDYLRASFLSTWWRDLIFVDILPSVATMAVKSALTRMLMPHVSGDAPRILGEVVDYAIVQGKLTKEYICAKFL